MDAIVESSRHAVAHTPSRGSVLTLLGKRLRVWTSYRHPHTNVYGLARSLLALGTLGTFVFTDTMDLFRPVVRISSPPNCAGVPGGSLFCLAGQQHLWVARVVAIGILLWVASGWRPQITGVLHWYISWSFFVPGYNVDGGDQITMVLTLLLVPVTIYDRRRWHWEAPVKTVPESENELLSTAAASTQIITLSCLTMVRVQMAGIYFHAATSKMGVPEWRDGTAVYYYFTHPWFGLADPLKSWSLPLLANGFVVTALTWGAMMLEILLFAGLIAARPYRKFLLRFGFAFHAAIAVVHGLLSFTLTMWAGLILFLHPVDEEFATLRARGIKLTIFLREIRNSSCAKSIQNERY